MNKFKKILALVSLIVIFTGCETYNDYEIGKTAIFPLSGEWLVRFTDISVTPNVTSGLITLFTYGTADNSPNLIWIRATSSSTAYTGRFTGKINCNPGEMSFDGNAAPNTYYTTAPIPTFTITSGKVELDSYTTASGGKSDKITFTMTDTRKSGKTYSVTGFRRTFWPEDEV
jgi:hypothetical protein